jgi:hypothetical protein
MTFVIFTSDKQLVGMFVIAKKFFSGGQFRFAITVRAPFSN